MTERYAESEVSTAVPPSTSTVGDGGTFVWSGTGDFFELLEFGERDRVELQNWRGSVPIDRYRYRLRAEEAYGITEEPRDLIEVLPLATEDLFLSIFYLPQLDLTASEGGEVNYAGVKGIAEEWLILDVLVTIKGKTDEQVTLWQQRKTEIEAQLRAQATDRDAAQPSEIRKVWHRTDSRGGLRRGGLPWRGGR